MEASARQSLKGKAGGRYAADLALQLPFAGPVPLHSTSFIDLIGSRRSRLTPLLAGMANTYQGRLRLRSEHGSAYPLV